MGAGARLAAERDRWPEHWRVADLDLEEDQLLELPRAGRGAARRGPGDAVRRRPRRRAGPARRHRPAGAAHRPACGARPTCPLGVVDVTACAHERSPAVHARWRLDSTSTTRQLAVRHRRRGRSPISGRASIAHRPAGRALWQTERSAAQQRGDGLAVGLAARRLHDGADEGAGGLVLAGQVLLPRRRRWPRSPRRRASPGRRCPSPRTPWPRRSPPASPPPFGDELGEHLLGLRGRELSPTSRASVSAARSAAGTAGVGTLLGEGLLDVDERPARRRRRLRRRPARSRPGRARRRRRPPRRRRSAPVAAASAARRAAGSGGSSARTRSTHASSGTSGTRSGSRKYR